MTESRDYFFDNIFSTNQFTIEKQVPGSAEFDIYLPNRLFQVKTMFSSGGAQDVPLLNDKGLWVKPVQSEVGVKLSFPLSR